MPFGSAQSTRHACPASRHGSEWLTRNRDYVRTASMAFRNPVQTATTAAVLRAAHQVLDDRDLILDDPVSLGLVDGASEQEIRAQEAKFQQPIALLARSQAVVRSRFVEDELASAAAAGTQTLISLGAGLDTFAYRQPAWARRLRIVEVDHPETQRFKKECLARAGIAIPDNTSFCPIDFDRQSLEHGLGAVIRFSEPVFFSWLGVTQYLASTAIEAVFRFVLGFPPASAIAFTFNLPEEALEGDDLTAAKFGANSAAAAGEPWVTCFEPEPLKCALNELGFSEIVHLSPELMSVRYFEGRKDGLRPSSVQQLIRASV